MAKVFDGIIVCPKCGSSDFHIENDTSFIGGDMGFYVCHKCGYSSKFFPEVKKSKAKIFKKEAKKKKGSKIRESHEKKLSFSKMDIIVLILGIVLLFVSIVGFVFFVGGYFALKKIFKKK